MRKIKSNTMLLFALLPVLTFLLVIYRSGEAPEFLSTLESTFGHFGMFFEPLLTPLLMEFVPLTDTVGVSICAWIIGYYVTLILVYLVFSLFTFLITIFMDKVDKIKGGK